MKKLKSFFLVCILCLILAACDQSPVTQTQDTVGATEQTELKQPENPNVIATAVTGSTVVQLTSVQELEKSIDVSGNTQVTLWQDIAYENTIYLPYSCTLDLNGHTVATGPDFGGGINIDAIGTENAVTVFKNGTMTQYSHGVQLMEGALRVENMTVVCTKGIPVLLYDGNMNYKNINCVENSTLASSGYCIAFSFDHASVAHPQTGITLQNSKLISSSADGSYLFSNIGGNANVGMVILGENVELYSYNDTLAVEGFYYSGMPVHRKDETCSVTVEGTVWENISCWANGQQEEVIDLLMIGNSFCYYYVQELYGIAEAAGVKINVTNLYEAGCNVQEHWAWLSNNTGSNAKYDYWITNSMGRWKHGEIRTSYDALAYLDWDVISLQQHLNPGRTVSYEVAINSCVPYTDQLFSYLKENHPNAKLYWHETWAYEVGHADMPNEATQTKQQDIIIQVSEQICRDNDVAMVPSGEAWKIARADSGIGDTLCNADKYHDGDLGGGQYLNACVWFEVLTGKSCVGNTWRPDYALSQEKNTRLQQIAHQAVAACYGEDYAQ